MQGQGQDVGSPRWSSEQQRASSYPEDGTHTTPVKLRRELQDSAHAMPDTPRSQPLTRHVSGRRSSGLPPLPSPATVTPAGSAPRAAALVPLTPGSPGQLLAGHDDVDPGAGDDLNELDAQALRREVWRLRNAHAQVTRERDGLQHGMRLMKTQMLQLKLEMEQRTLVEMQLESGMAELEQLFIDMQSKLATAQAGWRAKNQALRAAKKQQEATLRGLERQHAAKTDSLQAALQKRAKEADALRARVRGLEADQRRLKQQQRHAADTGEVTDLHCASLVRMMEV